MEKYNTDYKFDLSQRQLIDTLRSPYIYKFNLARNLALLSNDAAVVRHFYQVQIQEYTQDAWLIMQRESKFLSQYRPGQAFSYFGICPMTTNTMVRLIASGGFECKSDWQEADERLNRLRDEADLQNLFEDGVYWESGIGDFAYRLSYDPTVSDRPLIDIIEPHHLEVRYRRKQVVAYVVKETAEDDPKYELHEFHTLNQDGYCCISYRYYYNGEYVATNDEAMLKECRDKFPDIDTTERVLPIKGFATIIYKQNTKNREKLYKGLRGVPDIQGLDQIEDNLSETLSDFMDAIRKGGVREYVSEELRPQDAQGNDLPLDPFNKTIVWTKGSSSPGNAKQLYQVVQGDIRWEAYVEKVRLLISYACNKAGLSPTTIGMTGLESINSSQESQEARERVSMRTREIALNSWRQTLTELFNKYLQVYDYIQGREPHDYMAFIKIHFSEYSSPSVENMTDVLAKQVAVGLKSPVRAIEELNEGYTREDAEQEFMDILAATGQPILEDAPVDGEDSTATDIEQTAHTNGQSGNSTS